MRPDTPDGEEAAIALTARQFGDQGQDLADLIRFPDRHDVAGQALVVPVRFEISNVNDFDQFDVVDVGVETGEVAYLSVAYSSRTTEAP